MQGRCRTESSKLYDNRASNMTTCTHDDLLEFEFVLHGFIVACAINLPSQITIDANFCSVLVLSPYSADYSRDNIFIIWLTDLKELQSLCVTQRLGSYHIYFLLNHSHTPTNKLMYICSVKVETI